MCKGCAMRMHPPSHSAARTDAGVAGHGPGLRLGVNGQPRRAVLVALLLRQSKSWAAGEDGGEEFHDPGPAAAATIAHQARASHHNKVSAFQAAPVQRSNMPPQPHPPGCGWPQCSPSTRGSRAARSGPPQSCAGRCLHRATGQERKRDAHATTTCPPSAVQPRASAPHSSHPY